MKLLAISDLHVGFAENRRAVESMTPRPDDWLILAGDLGESEEHLRLVFDVLGPRFRQLMWVPGNHELYSDPEGPGPRGEDKYLTVVELCRRAGVLTPEDPFPVWAGEGGAHVLAPLFVLYDYSFCPPGLSPRDPVAWAVESGVLSLDQALLSPHPHASREARLEAAPPSPRC